MQHWLPFLNNSNQKILFNGRALGSILEKRLTTSLLPTLKPVLKPTLPSYTIYSKFLPLPSLTFYGPPLPSFTRSCDTRISSFIATSSKPFECCVWAMLASHADVLRDSSRVT